MKACEGDGDCEVQPDAECLSCILGMSDIEMKAFSIFLEGHKAEMKAAGLSSVTVESIVDAITV